MHYKQVVRWMEDNKATYIEEFEKYRYNFTSNKDVSAITCSIGMSNWVEIEFSDGTMDGIDMTYYGNMEELIEDVINIYV